MTTKEVTIYEKNEKTYCESCKPQGGKRGTLVISLAGYVFCNGCGEDFKEIAEREELKGMSLIDACKAVQARYTPEEWKRMAHTTAVTFSAEEIMEAAEPTVPAFRPMLTGLFREPCGRCHVVHTLGRCQQCNAPLCLNCANQGKGERLVCLACHVLFVRERAATEALQQA